MTRYLITCLCVVGSVFLTSFDGSTDGAKFIAFILAVEGFLILLIQENK